MFDQEGRFVIENYGKKPPIVNFLPGIAGKEGIPLWCYTVSRGQAVASFGVANKDHAIMEFYPAYQSYQNTQTRGFRTFIRVQGAVYEPFQDAGVPHSMHTGMHALMLRETNEVVGLETQVEYFGLPGECAAALVRKVEIRNLSDGPMALEVLDGLAELIPYGIDMGTMKNMAQTGQAWMRVEDVASGCPCFRVRASLADSASVTEITGGNFAFAVDGGKRLPAVVDTALVFGRDTSLRRADGFAARELQALLSAEQNTQNSVPCCFFAAQKSLAPGENLTLYALYGQAEDQAVAQDLAVRYASPEMFENKYREAAALVGSLCNAIEGKTCNPVFDAYAKQTYLDNVLRGGYPVLLGTKEKAHVFHLYSRKHGDLERDYNYFNMLPEYYSQGNGNFRDVLQNRRSDVRYHPYVEDSGIKTFMELVQLDGYNPLVIEQSRFTVPDANQAGILGMLAQADKADCAALLAAPFTPGRLAVAAQHWTLPDGMDADAFLNHVLSLAEGEVSASFGEGYWCDHWTYLLDMIESYLAIYPDREERLLVGERTYRYYEQQATVQPRSRRYVLTEKGVRQYHALKKREKPGHTWARKCYGAGEEIKSSLLEKLLLLCVLKFATLDPFGRGIEMEGGKPGWYDALNGLPGLLGSSVPETCELLRLVRFTTAALSRYPAQVTLPAEGMRLLHEVALLAEQYSDLLLGEADITPFWQAANDAKEAYRKQTEKGIAGEESSLSAKEVRDVLLQWEAILHARLDRMVSAREGICPTYFYYDVAEYEHTAEGIVPLRFAPAEMPLFLEGPVRWMKLDHGRARKERMHQSVRQSPLFDPQLKMYKVNTSLAQAPYEVGRATAFTPGWLENESIWLHMEYKYLLSLLEGGLYDAFEQSMQTALIPFLNAGQYGRSILENVSFIASSANANPDLRGRGFVARLSGSTAEFLHMWQIMLVGLKPFALRDGALTFGVAPYIPKGLMPEDGEITATLLGSIRLAYHAPGCDELVPGAYRVQGYALTGKDGSIMQYNGTFLPEEAALRIRNAEVTSVDVTVGKE